MPVMNALMLSLVSLGSFYLYPIFCCGISPMLTALAAGFFLAGTAVQGFLLWRGKKAAWFPVLCALAAGVPFFLIYLSSVLDRLIDQRVTYVPLIHHNPLIHSDLGIYVIIFSAAAAYALLGTLLGWMICRALKRKRAL